MQPFRPDFRAAYDMVRQAILGAGAEPFRIDEVSGPGSIIEEIYKAIESGRHRQ